MGVLWLHAWPCFFRGLDLLVLPHLVVDGEGACLRCFRMGFLFSLFPLSGFTIIVRVLFAFFFL